MAWTKGQSGNPAGRPKGARDQLSQAVYKEMLEDWSKHGLDTIKQVREKRPEIYLQAVIRLVPTTHDLTLDGTEEPVQWVINASPELSTQDWLDTHNIKNLNSPEMEKAPK